MWQTLCQKRDFLSYQNEFTISLPFILQEEIAAGNLSKARQLQAAVEEAEERADMAEQAVAKLRSKLRS